MVFVTTGTQKQNFKRIFDLVAFSKELENEEILAQTGYSECNYENIKATKFMLQEEFDKCMEQADIVICHAGAGTIFTALKNKKKVLAVPRLKKYGEHVDNHQIEICKELEKEEYILFFNDDSEASIEKFDQKIRELKSKKFKEYVSKEEYLDILRKEI